MWHVCSCPCSATYKNRLPDQTTTTRPEDSLARVYTTANGHAYTHPYLHGIDEAGAGDLDRLGGLVDVDLLVALHADPVTGEVGLDLGDHHAPVLGLEPQASGTRVDGHHLQWPGFGGPEVGVVVLKHLGQGDLGGGQDLKNEESGGGDEGERVKKMGKNV